MKDEMTNAEAMANFKMPKASRLLVRHSSFVVRRF
jgi:hypothetical protein